MNEILPFPMPPRVPAVEPELLASAVFVFGEYLDRLRADMAPPDETASADEEAPAQPEVDTKTVLDLFAEELGTSVPVTLALFLRVTALFRLLAQSPSLAQIALAPDAASDELSENALVAAARLDLPVKREGKEGAADFDPRVFRAALTRD
ncbi:MAG: hypothetical protein KGL11_14890 [Alphaproteobacteria bacterium]|nr:hypothetical protein [Alphaproteobacteria bacterium]